MASLQEYKGRYSGRVFLMGSGASLNRTPGVERLAGEQTFAGARFFKWGKLTPSFYLLAEDHQILNIARYPAQASVARFAVDWQPVPSGWVTVPRPSSLSFHHYTIPGTLLSPFEGECWHIHMGHDIPIAMLQVARYMGFSEFYLVGCEGTGGYAWDESEMRRVGDRLTTMRPLYARAKAELGGRLWDCTPEGGLNEVLGYKSLEEVLCG